MSEDTEHGMMSRRGLATYWLVSERTAARIAQRHDAIMPAYQVGRQIRYLHKDVMRLTHLMQQQGGPGRCFTQ